MSDAVLIALIVAVPALLSAPLMAMLTNRNAAAKEARDYARQDAVAEKAAEVAQKLLDQQAEQARLLKESQAAASAQAVKTNAEIEKLTGMLDGNFTKLMEDNLDAKVTSLVLARQLLAMTHEAGHPTTPEALAEIETLKSRIAELTTAITERKHTTVMQSDGNARSPGPLAVADDRTAVAAERSAAATERIATATEDKKP